MITDVSGITTNTISSINQITQTDLSGKQNNIVSTDDLTCNSITVSKTTPIENDELTSKIYVDNGLSEKQDTLIAGSNITIDIITDENGITSNTISSINQITIEDLDTKQPNILSTDNLTCNSITVTNTTPIENDELTSKIYVDTRLLEKQPNILSTTDLTCNTINTSSDNGISNIIGGFELKRFNNNVIQLNSNIDGGSIIAYNKNTITKILVYVLIKLYHK